VQQYERNSHEYAWEISRAFARAAHVLLGHLNAFANEGYLRTATQWDSLRKLASMVNYQPTPPASATSNVALMISVAGQVTEIASGLAMKFTPPEGGAALIFETLKPIKAHIELNAARAKTWDQNNNTLANPTAVKWSVPKKLQLKDGDMAVFTDGLAHGQAVNLSNVNTDEKSGLATLHFTQAGQFTPHIYNSHIWVDPEDFRPGMFVTTSSQTVIKMRDGITAAEGSIVRVTGLDLGDAIDCIVTAVDGNNLVVQAAFSSGSEVEVQFLTPIAPSARGRFETDPDIEEVLFVENGRVVSDKEGEVSKEGDKAVKRRFKKAGEDTKLGYAVTTKNRTGTGAVVNTPAGMNSAVRTSVMFAGKPPKSLRSGDWFVTRPMGTNDLTALYVVSTRLEKDSYYITFSGEVETDPQRTEFIGPMTKILRPENFDRSPVDAIAGNTCVLDIQSAEARALVRPGKQLIIVNDQDTTKLAASATIIAVEDRGTKGLHVELDLATSVLGWKSGWTTFHFNCVGISHGETQDPRILGSGDAERPLQDFTFKAVELSFIPSNLAVSGVAPDMDVAVDGVKWSYRDLTDPEADGTESWSIRLNDDNTYHLVFRRRLQTGTDNITVPRHRIGVGLSGSGVPPWSFESPMAKNRHVDSIIQPFATSGGADREAVASVRQNAPQSLAANGRAVSLKDFERLCQRHASVWQAKSREIIGPYVNNLVDVIVVPAGGGTLSTRLAQDLIDFMTSRAIPGVGISISGYQPVPITIGVKAFVNVARYEKSDVRDALYFALCTAFALDRRGLGQPFYVAEVLAEGERVPGVESLVITSLARKSNAPDVLKETRIANALAALFPKENQVAYVAVNTDISVTVEAMP
jgi:hypothetical protein